MNRDLTYLVDLCKGDTLSPSMRRLYEMVIIETLLIDRDVETIRSMNRRQKSKFTTYRDRFNMSDEYRLLTRMAYNDNKRLLNKWIDDEVKKVWNRIKPNDDLIRAFINGDDN